MQQQYHGMLSRGRRGPVAGGGAGAAPLPRAGRTTPLSPSSPKLSFSSAGRNGSSSSSVVGRASIGPRTGLAGRRASPSLVPKYA